VLVEVLQHQANFLPASFASMVAATTSSWKISWPRNTMQDWPRPIGRFAQPSQNLVSIDWFSTAAPTMVLHSRFFHAATLQFPESAIHFP